MIQASDLLHQLAQRGFKLFTGVPCSFIKPLINTAINSSDINYIGATNEGDAVAIACGSGLGGKRSVVMFQNSGLGNAVSPLTSLTATFRIPVLIITTWRGQPEQPPDEPQHELMGQITPRLFDLINIPWSEVSENEDDLAPTITRAMAHMESNKTPYGLLLKKGVLHPGELHTHTGPEMFFKSRPSVETAEEVKRLEPDAVLAAIQSSTNETDVICATTGYTGRALYALNDLHNQFYMVGSMGCVSSFGLGLATAQPHRRVIVIDGDGAFLMRMGALATIGHECPPNLTHILLDNGMHESTGGQATVSRSIDAAAVAEACGYQRVLRLSNLRDIEEELSVGPHVLKFIHIRTGPRSNRNLPRPTIKPYEVAERLKLWLQLTS
jgi:phosphonopyruvate decarboxylase